MKSTFEIWDIDVEARIDLQILRKVPDIYIQRPRQCSIVSKPENQDVLTSHEEVNTWTRNTKTRRVLVVGESDHKSS